MTANRRTSISVPRVSKAGEAAELLQNISRAGAYQKSMEFMWNYDLNSARKLLEPWRGTCMWHAGAYAECSALRVILTGRRSDAVAALELLQSAEQLLSSQEAVGGQSSVAQQVFHAELLLLRSVLQVFLGARLRAVYNLRQCWCTYRRLERYLALDEAAWESCEVPRNPEDLEFLPTEDLRGRLAFGLGFFYLATSLLPTGLVRLARLAGFATHRRQGKAFLAECAERCLGPRATLASVLLATYHLDMEPDVCRAGELLVASLGQQPENVLLHWAGSLLAWRNTCISQAVEMTRKALWCCGHELGAQAVYLRYELGMFHFMAMEWPEALEHLRFVHSTLARERVFFPYRGVVVAQLAAVAFSMGLREEGEELCRECSALHDPLSVSSLRLEADFAELLQLFLQQRSRGRELLAFEVMYLMRQLPRLPPPMLSQLHAQLERRQSQSQQRTQRQDPGGRASAATPSPTPNPAQSQRQSQSQSQSWPGAGAGAGAGAQSAPGISQSVWAGSGSGSGSGSGNASGTSDPEYTGAQVLRCIALFYLGDLEQAMTFVPELSKLCERLPRCCAYLSAHGLYWCGRMLSLNARRDEAVHCLQQAKAHKKYPFNIGSKICKVLEELDACGK